MYFYLKATHLTGFVLTVMFLSFVIAFPDADDDDRSVQLKIGFDLTQGTNGSPNLRIRNFEEIAGSRKLNQENKNPKTFVRADSSSESDNNEATKDVGQAKAILGSDLSDEEDDSGSDGDRRLSTKGLNPDDFEPEDRPKVHLKYKDEEDSE